MLTEVTSSFMASTIFLRMIPCSSLAWNIGTEGKRLGGCEEVLWGKLFFICLCIISLSDVLTCLYTKEFEFFAGNTLKSDIKCAKSFFDFWHKIRTVKVFKNDKISPLTSHFYNKNSHQNWLRASLNIFLFTWRTRAKRI